MQATGVRSGRTLYFGFGALIAIVLAAGADTLLVLRRITAAGQEASGRANERSQQLDRIRSGILETAVLSRDILLAPDSVLRRRLETARQDMNRAVEHYALLAGDSVPAEFRSLRSELHAYGKMLDLMFEMRAPSPFLNRDQAARRDAMLRLADQISALNRAEMAAREDDMSRIFAGFRVRILTVLSLTVLLGLGLAAGTIHRTLRLQASLTDLSARLVQAQENERRAISRELHDQVAQSLSAMLVELDNIAADAPGLSKQLGGIRERTRGAIEEVRNLALLLRPSMLDDLGLVPALEWQAREAQRRSGLRVQVHADESASELSDDHATCIFRVTQEALTNASRWAGAAHAEVKLTRHDGSVRLRVQDDGRGFHPSRAAGLGIAGMRERVHHLGGVFHIDSEPGKGAVVSVDLPL